MNRRILFSLFLLLLWLPSIEAESRDRRDIPSGFSIPILLYHRFGPYVADGMTVTTILFESHLKYLHDNAYKVIPLREILDNYLKGGFPPAPRSIAITADDGHRSVYTDVFPIIKKYRIPMTLFLYPSALSNASYAMTWDQLREMKDTGLFDFQSHSYWHPNFKKDRERLTPAEYQKFVEMQFKKSKEILEKELNVRVDMLAWPFGIHDDWLMKKASEVGYVAAFTMEPHPASPSDHVMAIPRYLMTDAVRGKGLEKILNGLNSRVK